jgi:hypothetical protein
VSDLAVTYAVPADVDQQIRGLRQRLLVIGGVAALACVAGAFLNPAQFLHSYLWSYLFFLGVSLGCMALNMLQYLTGGAWGVVIRRTCEAAMRTLPLLAVLFLPIVIGIPTLYEWSHPALVAKDEVLKHKQLYLNVPFFLIRAVVYFGGWILLSRLLIKWSEQQDTSTDRTLTRSLNRRLPLISGPGLVFWGLSVTFMATDWVMSLTPHWFSTMFGLLFLGGQGLNAMAFLIAVTVILSRRRPMSDVITPRHLHDLGKLMLALVMVWAYFSFSQFLIIWSGNLAEEIPWYVVRLHGGWEYIGLMLVVLHFALPFALLLSREVKRSADFILKVSLVIIAMRLVDLYWLVMPDYRKDGFGLSWMDFAAPIAVGGLWLWTFTSQLNKRPLLPLRDPHLQEALEHGR